MELVPDQLNALARARTRHTEAYQAYLKGRFHWNKPADDKPVDEGLMPAIRYYEQALSLDSRFAAAHAALARARILLGSHRSSRQAGANGLRTLRARVGAQSVDRRHRHAQHLQVHRQLATMMVRGTSPEM